MGASGHGRVVADIARLSGYDEVAFLDDDPALRECAGWPVVGDTRTPVDGDVFVAVGDASARRRLSDGLEPVTLVHPSAVVADGVALGAGTVVMAGAVLRNNISICGNCIVGVGAVVICDIRKAGTYVDIPAKYLTH